MKVCTFCVFQTLTQSWVMIHLENHVLQMFKLKPCKKQLKQLCFYVVIVVSLRMDVLTAGEMACQLRKFVAF